MRRSKKSITNKTLANVFEDELARLFSDRGFWVHRFQQNADGQPCDLVAIKGDRPCLIDAKYCEGDYFDTKRVEENQKLAMYAYTLCGNLGTWFAIKIHGNIYMVNYEYLKSLPRLNLSEDIIAKHGYSLEYWFERHSKRYGER